MVQMTNYRGDKKNEKDLTICVNTISIASKTYKVKPLLGNDLDNMAFEIKPNNGHEIGWQEQVSLHYLIRANSFNHLSDLISQCSMKNSPENQQKPDTTIADFACLEHAFEIYKVCINLTTFDCAFGSFLLFYCF